MAQTTKRILVILATVVLSECSASVPPPDFEITVADSEAPWVHAATDEAIDFWIAHNVLFLPTDSGRLSVVEKPLPDDRVAECDCRIWLDGDNQMRGDAMGEIHIRPELGTSENYNDRKRGCVIAHEMGHSIGMDHVVQGPSLMAPFVTFSDDGDCLWSDLDQAELCRAQPKLCKEVEG